MWTPIATQIAQATGQPFEVRDRRPVGGGCINQAVALSDGDRTYFVKVNAPTQVEMFAAEALALKEMHATQTIRVPQPICWGSTDNHSFIAMEWLEFGRGNNAAWEQMGRNLAALHRHPGPDQFGWAQNNTIGSTPQINTWMDAWSDFFAEQRIGYQLRLAKRKGGRFPNVDEVVAAVRERLADRQPQPSFLHGDLWSGNAAFTATGEPTIIDPAAYWGDREADLAMTELFGGFPAAFYRGYDQAWAIDSGYQQRKSLYNLYHVLNHFNLFGGGYGSQASRTIDQLLR